MEFIFFVGGLVIGFALTMIYKARERIHGIIHVDHKTEQCIFNITSDQLANPKNKIAVFIIDHNADISRE